MVEKEELSMSARGIVFVVVAVLAATPPEPDEGNARPDQTKVG